MTVLWITENHPPGRGGMAQSCDRIVRGLRAAGVAIDVVHLTRREQPATTTREQGGQLFTVPLGDDPEHALRLLWTTLRANRYERIVAFGGTYPLLAAPVYAAWAGIPLVTLLRGNDFDTGVFSLRRQPIVREALRASARVCVVARSWAPLVSALAPDTEVTWVPNSIDLTDWTVLPSERQKADAWRAEHGPGRRVVGLIGQLKNKKGVQFLLDAIVASGQTSRVHLILAGELEESTAGRLDVLSHTRFPFLDRFELPAVYAACDVVALPSFYDGLPNVALEAAALGIPLLASDAGGLADLVDDTIGFRFAAGDPHDCRAAVHRALTVDEASLATLGARAAERVRSDFVPSVETERYLRILDV